MKPVRRNWTFASYLHYARWDIELSCGHHIVAARPATDTERYLCPECTGNANLTERHIPTPR